MPFIFVAMLYKTNKPNVLAFLQNDSTTEDDDDGDDDDDEEVVTILPEDKYRVGSLEKMISVMAVLVEESRGERCRTFSLLRRLCKELREDPLSPHPPSPTTTSTPKIKEPKLLKSCYNRVNTVNYHCNKYLRYKDLVFAMERVYSTGVPFSNSHLLGLRLLSRNHGCP